MDKIIDSTDKLKNLFHTYYEQLMVWYRGLDDVGQFGVMAAFIVIIFFHYCRVYNVESRKKVNKYS